MHCDRARRASSIARISCKFVPEKLSFVGPTVTLGTRVFSFSCATFTAKCFPTVGGNVSIKRASFDQVTQYVTIRDFKEKTSKARYSG